MTDAGEFISYDEWGQRFFAMAVTRERILGGVNTLAGQQINVGPMGVGPARLAKVTATGAIGEAQASPIAGDTIAYRIVLPVHLTFEVNLQVDSHRFSADLEVPILLAARAAAPLFVVIEATPPLPNQIGIRLRAEGLRASVLSKAVGIEGELQRFIAKYVKRELNKPAIVAARTVDVGAAMEKAWRSMAPKESSAVTVTADLAGALEQEIKENPQLIEDLTD